MAEESKKAGKSRKEKAQRAWRVMPEVWAMMKKRRGVLALGLLLMAVNRVAGLALPASRLTPAGQRHRQTPGPVADAARGSGRARHAHSGSDFLRAYPARLEVRAKAHR